MADTASQSRSGAVDPIELAGRIQDFRHEARGGKTMPTYSRALYLKEPEWDAVIAALRAVASEIQEPNPAQSVPAGMWYFTYYSESFNAVQRVRVQGVSSFGMSPDGVTGIAKKGAP
jgi:hypothetical protein